MMRRVVITGMAGVTAFGETWHSVAQRPVSYTHLTLPTNREV